MYHFTRLIIFFFTLFSLLPASNLDAQTDDPIIGKWDLTLSHENGEYPSWLEVIKSGNHTLVGRFVHDGGSARPISEVKNVHGIYHFSIPIQWEEDGQNLTFECMLKEDKLNGQLVIADGSRHKLTGIRAPMLPYIENPSWGAPIALFNGKDIDGWHASGKNQWVVENGILKSPISGSNLISNQKFMHFKVHAEFRYPEGGNSGLYLRGRYETQIADNIGEAPSNIFFGGIYGFLTPNEIVAKNPGEWQTFDITLIGNRVTVVANGKSVITDQIIPGITGGALDSEEGEPGPLMIQGDHEPVEFRSLVVIPLLE
jgi:hypothetical protein